MTRRALAGALLSLAVVVGLVWWPRRPPPPSALERAPSSPAPIARAAPVRLDRPMESPLRFVTVNAGEFRLERGRRGDFWAPETMAGGVAIVDLDGDELHDIYHVQADRRLPVGDDPGRGDVVWRQLSGGAWATVPPFATPPSAAFGDGVAAADLDEDGFVDLVLTDFGGARLLLGAGDGCFRAGPDLPVGSSAWATSAAVGDLDGDGHADIVVACYAIFDPATACHSAATRRRRYCGPEDYPPERLRALRNRADGTYVERAVDWGMGQSDGKCLGVAIATLREGEPPCVFVANDLVPNFLFRPVAQGPATRFVEDADALGVAVNGEGVREAGMGIAVGDADGDGRPDLLVTHFYLEHDTIWLNGPNGFRDATRAAGLAIPTRNQLSWGTHFVDLDNDGNLDIATVSGHLLDETAAGIPFLMPAQVFRNVGKGRAARFVDVSDAAGPEVSTPRLARGSAVGDVDGDGRPDWAIVRHFTPSALLRNVTETANRAIALRLIGVQSPRDGWNAVVTVHPRGDHPSHDRPATIVRERHGGGGYQSADAPELLIGVGPGVAACDVEIRWRSGAAQRLTGLPTGRRHWVKENVGAPVRSEPFVAVEDRR